MHFIVLILVITVFLIWRSVHKSNSQSLDIKESLLEASIVKEKQQKENLSSKEFKDKLLKFYDLYRSNIIDNTEFENQKDKLIGSLANKNLSESKLDFLLDLSTLQSENILSKENLSKIKTTIHL